MDNRGLFLNPKFRSTLKVLYVEKKNRKTRLFNREIDPVQNRPPNRSFAVIVWSQKPFETEFLRFLLPPRRPKNAVWNPRENREITEKYSKKIKRRHSDRRPQVSPEGE